MKKMFMLFMVTYLLLTMSISAQNRENSFTRAPLVSTAIREGKQRNVISTQNERIRSFTSGATRATVSSYNFNNGMPSGFQLRNPNSYYNWEVGMNGSSSAFEIPPSPDGTAYAYINDDAANDDLSDVWMILPVMDFSTLTSPRLEFENFRVSLGDIFTIKISTTGTTWTNLITYPTDEELEAWQTEEISLTSYAGQSTVYIAFHYNDDDDWLYGWAIDNIRVFQPEEDDLAITNVTPSLTVPGDAVIPTVTVTNRGLNSASVWSINLTDGDSYNSTVTGIELAPGASTTVNMDAWSPAAGTYTLIATLSFTEDDDLQNNTMTITTRVSPFQGDAFTGNTTERSYNIVNISNGSTTEIGTIERSPFPMAEEFDGTTVYRIYEDNTIGFVNTEGIYSQLGNITGISGSVMSISYDWDVEQMYLLAVDDYNYSLLYTLDMNTYVATLVGTSSSPSMIIAIDLAYDGYFYGPGIADDMLHKISKTGVFTPVGALGVNINYGQDVSYNHNDGRLYTYTCGDYITRAYGYYDLSTGAFVPITHSGDNQYATLVMMPEHLPLCDTISNLTATVDDNNDVTLTWTAPATMPAGYEIYSNGTLLTTVTTTVYTHASVANGIYYYSVKPLFESNCFLSENNIEVTVGDVCQLTFDMYDDALDGWDGGSRIDIVQYGNVINSVTCIDDYHSTETIAVAGEVDFVWVSLSNYDYECSFTISYEGEEIYASSGTPTAGTFFTWACVRSCESVINLTAESDDNNVTLTWTAPATTPTGYEIYFNGTLLTTVTTTTYTHTAVADGVHTYTVKALFEGEDCEPTGVNVEITIGDVCQLTFNMFDSDNDSWNDGSRIDIVQDGNAIASITHTGGSSSTETVVVAGEVDFVWVSLGNYDYECSFTISYEGEEIYASSGTPTAGTFFTWTCGIPCESVTNLTAEDNDNNVTLSWTAPTTTPTGYEIYFNGTLLTTVTTTTYTHTAVADGIYTYMVKALFDGEDCVPIGVSTEITVGDVCSVTINMFGDYDDSWTWGSYINIVQNSVVIATLTLPEGNYSDSRTIIIPGGETQFVWVEGDYDDECSFTISFGGEQIYASSGTPTAGTFFTWGCIFDCDDVTNLEGVADARNITLSWDPASSNVTSWEIEFKPVGSTTFYTRTSDIPEDFISGVSENTEYLIRVRAICYGFSGEWDTIYVRTQSENTFTLTGIATPSNGGTVNPPLVTVSANSSQQFNFAANISWTIDSVTVNGNRVEYTPGTGNTGTYNISNIMQDYTVEVFFKNHSGITENDYDKIKLYPNPAHNAINIETQSLYKKVEIVNVIGEVIHSENIENMKFNLDISDMVSGLYIVRLHGDQGVATRKFVKE